MCKDSLKGNTYFHSDFEYFVGRQTRFVAKSIINIFVYICRSTICILLTPRKSVDNLTIFKLGNFLFTLFSVSFTLVTSVITRSRNNTYYYSP